jgi:hypothetical protein
LGIVPDLRQELVLRYVTTPVASKLTGLSTEKLREWTSRRALVPADVRPKQQGSPAKFSWQTILVLRIAVTLRDGFRLELQSYKSLFAALRHELRRRSFLALWGHSLVLGGSTAWSFVEEGAPAYPDDALLIHLDPHLRAISAGFALPNPTAMTGQLDLFSLPALRATKKPVGGSRFQQPAQAATQRRSA